VIDRSKVLLTRRTAARRCIAAHGRHEGVQPSDHLGRAWTPWPAGLFVADQLVHLVVAFVAWACLLSGAASSPAGSRRSTRSSASFDPAAVHDVSRRSSCSSLAIANVLARPIFVAILVRPVEQSEGETRWGRPGRPVRRRPAGRARPEHRRRRSVAALVGPDRPARRPDRGGARISRRRGRRAATAARDAHAARPDATGRRDDRHPRAHPRSSSSS
jgi:hypothetical protein